jgi:sulfoxide reductase heme-binding subunit YedZ
LNTQTGYVTLVLILINLILGTMLAFWKRWPTWWRWIFSERRSVGIASGCYAILHFLSYLGKEGFQSKAWSQLYTKIYLTMGLSAFVIVVILLLTSNDLSIRLMKMWRWRRLHRLIHVACIFILAHLFLIEKANLALLALLTLPLVPFQLYRLFRYLRKNKGAGVS